MRRVLAVVSAGLLLAALTALVLGVNRDTAKNGDGHEQRYAVRWQSIALSDDRRTITVVASYPLAGFCVKRPDGIDVNVAAPVSTVAVWMSGPSTSGGSSCTAECGRVTQATTLDQPLPAAVERFEPIPGAAQGCAG